MKNPTKLYIIGIPILIGFAVFIGYTDPNGFNNFFTGFSTSGAIASGFLAIYSELLLGKLDQLSQLEDST